MTKYLVDTAVFLWVYFGSTEKIPAPVLRILDAADCPLVLSAVSLWEVAIKYCAKKLDLKKDPAVLLPPFVLKMGFQQLPVTARHALGVSRLPFHHRDPFDRLLISQARLENLVILSPDPVFKKYRVRTLW